VVFAIRHALDAGFTPVEIADVAATVFRHSRQRPAETPQSATKPEPEAPGQAGSPTAPVAHKVIPGAKAGVPANPSAR
jgi:hypothetical protein